MLNVLFGSTVGVLSLITIIATCGVVVFWLYFIFMQHDE